MSDEGKVDIGSIGGDLSGNVAGRNIIQGNVTIGSTLTNVTQQVGSLPQVDPADKAELEQLLGRLEAELEKLPAEKQEEAETVAELTQELVEEAGREKPKKSKLRITGEGLKTAAQNLATVAPLVGEIAAKIVAKILAAGS